MREALWEDKSDLYEANIIALSCYSHTHIAEISEKYTILWEYSKYIYDTNNIECYLSSDSVICMKCTNWVYMSTQIEHIYEVVIELLHDDVVTLAIV